VPTDPYVNGRTTVHVTMSLLIKRPGTLERLRFTRTQPWGVTGRRTQLLRRVVGGTGRQYRFVVCQRRVRRCHVTSVLQPPGRGRVPGTSKCRLDPSVLRQVDCSAPGLIHRSHVSVATQQNRRGMLVTLLCLQRSTQNEPETKTSSVDGICPVSVKLNHRIYPLAVWIGSPPNFVDIRYTKRNG